MSYKEFVQHLKTKEPLQAYIFFGKERYLINWAIDALKDKYITTSLSDFNYDKMDGTAVNFEDIVNICETLPMMSDRRMVVLDNFPLLEGEKVRNFSDEDEKQFVKYLEQNPSSNIFVITGGEKIDKRKSLYKKFIKSGSIFEFALLQPPDLKKWISKRFKQNGKTISNGVLQTLIEATGYYDKDSDYTLYNFENDIKKILHLMGNEQEAQDGHILQTVTGHIERNVFDFVEAISNNKKSEALKVLNFALLYGEAEYRLLALLNRQFENLLQVKIFKENGKNILYIREKLSLPDFVISKLIKASNGFSVERLRKANMKICEADKNIKTGITDPRLALELLVAEI